MADQSNNARDSGRSQGGFFRGDERLETFSLLGRPIRKGSPKNLSVSDAARIRESLRAKNGDLARQYLALLRPGAEAMVALYTEYVYALVPVLEKRAIDSKRVLEAAHSRWSALIESHPDLRADSDRELMLKTFHADRISADTVAEYRKNLTSGQPTVVNELLKNASAIFTELSAAIDRGDWDGARTHFDAYFLKMRVIHDDLVDLYSLLLATIAKFHGQKVAEESLQQSFTTCLLYEGLWQAVGAMNSEELAAFLTEHLRQHFSGPKQEGSVEVIEEKDHYHLVFDACGSGGAMRRRALSGVPDAAAPLPEASPTTWSRAGEVPMYCTHCAMNELESIRRMGYPVLVTAFHPDPRRPCGWLIYKTPDAIPEEYFTRLGEKKDPKRFFRR